MPERMFTVLICLATLFANPVVVVRPVEIIQLIKVVETVVSGTNPVAGYE
jgi:hypothetical protein